MSTIFRLKVFKEKNPKSIFKQTMDYLKWSSMKKQRTVNFLPADFVWTDKLTASLCDNKTKVNCCYLKKTIRLKNLNLCS